VIACRSLDLDLILRLEERKLLSNKPLMKLYEELSKPILKKKETASPDFSFLFDHYHHKTIQCFSLTNYISNNKKKSSGRSLNMNEIMNKIGNDGSSDFSSMIYQIEPAVNDFWENTNDLSVHCVLSLSLFSLLLSCALSPSLPVDISRYTL
jgi:hypothetical protein